MSAAACWSCGAACAGTYCGTCGAELALGTGGWQDGIYLGPRAASLFRRGPQELGQLLPLLLAPFRHLDAIPANRWRWIALTAVMGITPLVLVSVFEGGHDPVDGLKAVAFYFSALWALFFASAFRAGGIRWRTGLFAYFGTMLIGMTLLGISLALNLELFRGPFINAPSLLVSIPSSIAMIGIPEELTKALVLLAIWRWAKQLPSLRAFLFYGLLSGLGFGIKEGMDYVLGPYAAHYAQNKDVAEFFFGIMLRLSSLPFLHAMWTGIAAFLIWFAARVPSARTGLLVLAILIPATFHGLYDALIDPHVVLALIVAATSIAVLGIYAASASQMERWFGLVLDDPDADEPALISAIPAVSPAASAASARH